MNRQNSAFRMIAALTVIVCLFDNVAQAGQISFGSPVAPSEFVGSSSLDFNQERVQGESFLKLISQNGDLVESRFTKNKGLFILIQDAHLYEDAQKRIAALVRDLVKTTGIRSVGLEGASGELAHHALSGYPNSKSRAYLADYFLSRGWINGAEYAALKWFKDLRLLGLEEPVVYEQNRQEFIQISKSYKKLQPDFQDWNKTLEQLAHLLFPSDEEGILMAGLKKDDFQAALHYFDQIASLSQKYGIQKKYPQLEKAAYVLKLQKEINHRLLREEFSRMKTDPQAVELRENIKGRKALRFEGRGNFQLLHQNLKKKYPESFRFLDWKIRFLELNTGLIPEWKEWVAELAKKVLKNESQIRLFHLIQVAQIARDMASLELDISEWKYYEQHRSWFTQVWIRESFSKLLPQSFGQARGRQEFFKNLEKTLQQAEHFYAQALLRDTILSRRAREEAANLPNQSLIIVSGGFHTSGFRDDFRKKNLSYVILRPRFSSQGSLKKQRSRYENEMADGGTLADLVQRLQFSSQKAEVFSDARLQLETPRRFPTLNHLRIDSEGDAVMNWPLLSLGVPLLRTLDHVNSEASPSISSLWTSVQLTMTEVESASFKPLFQKLGQEKVLPGADLSGAFMIPGYWNDESGFAAAWGSKPSLPFSSRKFPVQNFSAGKIKVVFSGVESEDIPIFVRMKPARKIRFLKNSQKLGTSKRHFLDRGKEGSPRTIFRSEIRTAVGALSVPKSENPLKKRSVMRKSQLASWRTWAMILPLFGILGTQPLYAGLKKTSSEERKPAASLKHEAASKETEETKRRTSQIKKEVRALLLKEGVPFTALSKVQKLLEKNSGMVTYRYQVGDLGTKRPDLSSHWISKTYQPSPEVLGLLYELKNGHPKPAEISAEKSSKASEISAHTPDEKPASVELPEKPVPLPEPLPEPVKNAPEPESKSDVATETSKAEAAANPAPSPPQSPAEKSEEKVSEASLPLHAAFPEFHVPYTDSSRPVSVLIPTFDSGKKDPQSPVVREPLKAKSTNWSEKFHNAKDRVSDWKENVSEGARMSWNRWKERAANFTSWAWKHVSHGNAATILSTLSGAFWGLWAVFSKRLLKYWPDHKMKGDKELEITGQDLLARAHQAAGDHDTIRTLDDQLTAETQRIDQLSQKTKLPFTGWFSVFLTFLVEALTMVIPFAIGGGPGVSLGFVIGTYLFLRLGLMAGASLNESGHWLFAKKGGHENITFKNHGLFFWMLKLLPLSWFFFNPYVELEEVPSRAQASLIREGGWGIAAAGIFIFWSLSVWAGIPLFAYPWVQAALWGGLLAVLLSLGTDLANKNYHPRFYLCGIAGYFSPKGESILETIKIIFELIRTVSVRGGQAGGFVTVHDVRSKMVIWAALSLVLSIGAAGLFLIALPILGVSISTIWILAAFAAIPALSAFPVLFIESGQVMNRSRTTNAKRADLTLSMLTNVFFEMLILILFFDRTTWTLILAHARYSTSSPDAVATQPHTWEPTTLYNLLFRRTRVRSLSHGHYQSSLKWTNPVVGHNGDLNGFFFLMLKKYISHNEGKLHPFLDALLQAANRDKGDTVNISGIMKLLTTQGDVGASFRLAHLFVVMQEPHEVLEAKQLERVTKRLNAFLSQNELRYEAMLERDAPDLDHLENVPASIRTQMAEDFFRVLQSDPEFSTMVPPAKQREFAEKLIFYYHEATPFFAMKEFAVLVDPLNQSTAGIGSADGTFGLFSYSAAHREVAIYKKGQSVSVAFDESYSRFWLASDRTPLNDGRARYRLDLQDDEIFRIRWDENGKLDWCVYSVLENKMIPIDQIRARMRDMRTDPVMAPRPSPYARFPMDENAQKIPLVVRNAWTSLFDSNHPNYHNVEIIVKRLAELAHIPHLPEGVHVLIYGSETDPSYGLLLKQALEDFFPALNIEVYLSDEQAEPAVEYVHHPEAFMQRFGITSETLVIPISNSGRSFDTDQVLGWLCTQVNEVVAILGDMDNLMADRIGPGRVLSTGVGGLQTAEPRTHVNDAMHALISAAVVRVAEDLYTRFPNQTILKSPLNMEHVKALKAHWREVETRIQKIAGLDRSGKLVHHFLTSAGKRIAGFSLESPITHFATLMFYAAAVQFGWVVFPTAILAYYGIAFSGLMGGLVGIALNYLFLYFFGRMAVTGFWRILGRALDRVRMFFNYHPIFSRKLLKRPTSPRIYIGEAKHRFVPLRQTLRKATALGWENTPSIDAADMSQINHEFVPTRGDVLLGIQRRHHPARQGSDRMALRQMRGNRSFGESVFTIVIGHDLKPDPDTGDEFIDLEDGRTHNFYAQFGFEAVPDIHVRRLSELFFDSLERSVAEHVLATAFARTLAFPWFTRWAIAPVLSVPAVGWVAYLVMIRYPWLFRFYPYWATQPRTVVATTATPTDMSQVQAELARRQTVEGFAKLQKVKPLPLPAALKLRAEPLVPLPEEVYQTGERKKTPSVSAPFHATATPGSKPALPKSSPVLKKSTQAPMQRQLQELRLTAFLERLEAEVTHGRGNGGLEPALKMARQELEAVRHSGYPDDLVTGFERMVKDRLPEVDDEPAVRSELRQAFQDISVIKDQMTFSEFKRQWMGDLDALADSETYTPVLETLTRETFLSRGAYIMVNPESVRLMEKIYQSLPREGEFIVFFDHPAAPTRIQEMHRVLARNAGPRVHWIVSNNLNLWLEKEIARRQIGKQEVLILSTEGNQEAQDAGVPNAVALAAAKLSERSWVVVGQNLKSKLTGWNTYGISEVLSRLLESERQTERAA